MGSKVNSQQALVHWPREITKAKISPFLFTSFSLKRGEERIFGQFLASLVKFGQVQASLGKFGQVWTSLGKLGQVWTSLDQAIKWQNQNKTERIRKGKQKFEW